MGVELVTQDFADARLGATGFGTVVVGEVEVVDTDVEGGLHHVDAGVMVGVGAEIVPHAQ